MHIFLLFLTWVTLSSCTPGVISPVKWRNYAQGLQEAKLKKRVILIQFYANWCPFCKQMDAFVMGDSQVQQWLETKYVPIRVYENAPNLISVRGKKITEAQWRENIGFSGYPTHMMMTSDERVIYRFTGSRTTADFLRILESSFKQSQRSVAAQ